MLYSIVIVNYKSSDYVVKCIESIKAKTLENDYEVIVVDNSEDDEELAEKIYPNVYIKSGGNIGFGRACNLGVQHSKGERIVLVNPDVIFLGDVINLLADSFYNYGADAFYGVNLLDSKGKPNYSYGNFPSILGSFYELFFIHKMVPDFYSKYDIGLLVESEPGKVIAVDYVSGALVAVSKEVFLKLNGFSNEIFLYFEETELMYRHKAAGGNCFLLCHALAEHLGSAVIGENSDFKIMNLEKGLNSFYKTRYKKWLMSFAVCIRSFRLLFLFIYKRKLVYLRAININLKLTKSDSGV